MTLPHWDLTAVYPEPAGALADVAAVGERCRALANRAEAEVGRDASAVASVVAEWGALERELTALECYGVALQYDDATRDGVEDVGAALQAAIAQASRARVRFDDGSGERELDLPGLREVAVSHESRPVRIDAYEAMGRAYGGLAEVVAACWDSAIADRLVDHRLRGRRHPADATLEEQDLPPAVFTSLLEAIADSHGALQGFLQRRASSLGVEKLHATDVSANPPGASSITFDDAWETSMAALRALVPELEAQGRALLAANRADAEDRPGKQGGAICLPSRLEVPSTTAQLMAADLLAGRDAALAPGPRADGQRPRAARLHDRGHGAGGARSLRGALERPDADAGQNHRRPRVAPP